MRSRLFWRRSAAAAGIYSSAVLGFVGTVVALHLFSTRTFGLYALVLAATGFFQSFLDVTVEEALIKFCEDVMNLHPSRLLKNDLECGGLTPLLNFARNHIDES